MLWDKKLKKKAVTFSYDDGTVYDLKLIKLLDKYGLKSTFNLSSECLPKHKDEVSLGRYRKICRNDVKSVYENHEVAVHTLNHVHLTSCDDREVVRQMEEDRLKLSELAEYEVCGMAYPFGDFDERVEALIKNNTAVRYCRTVVTSKNFELHNNILRLNPTVFHLRFEKLMSLAQEFIELRTDTPKLFYIFGHSYELEAEPENWKKLEAFFEIISKRDDIFYGENREVVL